MAVAVKIDKIPAFMNERNAYIHPFSNFIEWICHYWIQEEERKGSPQHSGNVVDMI